MGLTHFKDEASSKKPFLRKFIAGLKNKNLPRIDDRFLSIHEEVFEQTDCLACANYCKTTSPISIPADID